MLEYARFISECGYAVTAKVVTYRGCDKQKGGRVRRANDSVVEQYSKGVEMNVFDCKRRRRNLTLNVLSRHRHQHHCCCNHRDDLWSLSPLTKMKKDGNNS